MTQSCMSAALTGGLVYGAFLVGALRYAGPKRSHFGPSNCWVLFDAPLAQTLIFSLLPTWTVLVAVVATAKFSKNATISRWGYTLAMPLACATYLTLSAYFSSMIDY